MSRSDRSVPLAPLYVTGGALLLAAVLTGFSLRPESGLSPRFNHVMLYVSDLDASIAFYTEAFDLDVTQLLDSLTIVQPDGSETSVPVRMAFLKFEGQDFVLELSEQELAWEGEAPFFQHLGVDVVDIEAAAARAEAAGAREPSGIRTVHASGGVVARNAFFLGPDGELLELMQVLAGEF